MTRLPPTCLLAEVTQVLLRRSLLLFKFCCCHVGSSDVLVGEAKHHCSVEYKQIMQAAKIPPILPAT